MLAAIEKSKDTTLPRFYLCFGYWGVGEHSDEFSHVIWRLAPLMAASIEALQNPDVGEKPQTRFFEFFVPSTISKSSVDYYKRVFIGSLSAKVPEGNQPLKGQVRSLQAPLKAWDVMKPKPNYKH